MLIKTSIKFCIALALWGVLIGCNQSQNVHPSMNTAKAKQYYIQGKKLYISHCSNCHQKNGKGLGLVFPPVDESDFIDNHFERVICLIRNGIDGEIVVNGKTYNKAMPPMSNPNDLEIAEIATYIYNTWGRKHGLIDTHEVNAILKKCEDQK
jgi:cytochrome c551